VGIGWNLVNGRTFTQTVGTLLPGDGRTVYFVVRVHDPLPDGGDNLVNLICGGSDESDVSTDDNCNYEDTPVRRWPLRVEKRMEDCISPGDALNDRHHVLRRHADRHAGRLRQLRRWAER
jgi:hypothetical protein